MSKTALMLCKALKRVEKTKFSGPVQLSDLIRGEAVPPDAATTFFKILYGSLDIRAYGPDVVRRADASSQDALVFVNKGRVKPQKQITPVMGVKSLTGSRKILTVLSRFRHAINYHCAEELETAKFSTSIFRKRMPTGN